MSCIPIVFIAFVLYFFAITISANTIPGFAIRIRPVNRSMIGR
ncbi:MAG TPA: hypothetical protein VKN36_01230 [Eudoraea sp.]|nr:hypothetical protein [Eudoraea sp.]